MSNKIGKSKPQSARRNGIYVGKLIRIDRDSDRIAPLEKKLLNVEFTIKKVEDNSNTFDSYNQLLGNSTSLVTIKTTDPITGLILGTDEHLALNTNGRMQFRSKNNRLYRLKHVETGDTAYLEIKCITVDEVTYGVAELADSNVDDFVLN